MHLSDSMADVNGSDTAPGLAGTTERPNKGPTEAAKPKYTYGHIRLDISNSVLPVEKLAVTPSSQDGLSEDSEVQIRSLSCELIQLAGKLLRLPQVAMATGCVLFHRFYYAKSFVRLPFDIVAMCCVELASKIEEAPRRIRDIINVFTHIKQIRNGKTIQPVVLDQNYISLKNQIIKAERRVLKELGFCVHVRHPHKIIVMYLQWLKLSTSEELLQMSWNFMNDSLRTDVFVRYPPETIASACIYLSARKLRVSLPKNPSWFTVLSVEEDDIKDCCYRIVSLYNRKKPNQEELECVVDGLRKKLDESRKAARDQLASAVGTPSRSSPISRSGSPSRPGANSTQTMSSGGLENGAKGPPLVSSTENILGFRERQDHGHVEKFSDGEDENRHYRRHKKHKRSRSKSVDEHRSRRDRKKNKPKRRGSQSPGSPYSPSRKGKRHRDKRHDSRDRDQHYRRHAEPGVRGGCFAASDNIYHDDRDREREIRQDKHDRAYKIKDRSYYRR